MPSYGPWVDIAPGFFAANVPAAVGVGDWQNPSLTTPSIWDDHPFLGSSVGDYDLPGGPAVPSITLSNDTWSLTAALVTLNIAYAIANNLSPYEPWFEAGEANALGWQLDTDGTGTAPVTYMLDTGSGPGYDDFINSSPGTPGDTLEVRCAVGPSGGGATSSPWPEINLYEAGGYSLATESHGEDVATFSGWPGHGTLIAGALDGSLITFDEPSDGNRWVGIFLPDWFDSGVVFSALHQTAIWSGSVSGRLGYTPPRYRLIFRGSRLRTYPRDDRTGTPRRAIQQNVRAGWSSYR